MNKLLVICGPTAIGKTSLGIKLAKKFNGEIVSADSRQVYKGMDIGTGKDLSVNSKFEILSSKQIRNSTLPAGRQEFEIRNYQIGYYVVDGVRVWLYDVVEPDYQFSMADYIKCAQVVINHIWKRGKLSVLVGGTGLYIKGVVDGIGTMGIKPDFRLREKFRNLEIEKLQEKLKKFDPERWERMNESDRQNPQRLVRAIEIALQIRNSKFEISNKLKILNSKFKTNNTLWIALTAPNTVLYERIDKRVDERVKQGIIKEIEGLLKKGYAWENSALGATMGYKKWQDCFAGSRFKVQGSRIKEVIQKWKYNEHAYARRQMTWFRKDKRIQWIDIDEKGWQNKVGKLVNKWHKRKVYAED